MDMMIDWLWKSSISYELRVDLNWAMPLQSSLLRDCYVTFWPRLIPFLKLVVIWYLSFIYCVLYCVVYIKYCSVELDTCCWVSILCVHTCHGNEWIWMETLQVKATYIHHMCVLETCNNISDNRCCLWFYTKIQWQHKYEITE